MHSGSRKGKGGLETCLKQAGGSLDSRSFLEERRGVSGGTKLVFLLQGLKMGNCVYNHYSWISKAVALVMSKTRPPVLMEPSYGATCSF